MIESLLFLLLDASIFIDGCERGDADIIRFVKRSKGNVRLLRMICTVMYVTLR